MKRHPTRFKEIELGEIAPGSGWSYFSTETGGRVGPVYKTKAEALADLTRYAREGWGLE